MSGEGKSGEAGRDHTRGGIAQDILEAILWVKRMRVPWERKDCVGSAGQERRHGLSWKGKNFPSRGREKLLVRVRRRKN